MKRIGFSLIALAVFVVSTSCQKTGFLTRYGIFHVQNDTTVIMNGTIGGRTEKHWDNLIENHPKVTTLILEDCPGSKNDEVNLKVSQKIHDAGVNTHLRSNSIIASGAVDLFLAGNQRTIETGAQLGVHSWSEGGTEASELPESDPKHQPYIDYYLNVGFSQQEARDFYFFTIYAAKASDIHWMTPEEIERYNMAK